MATNMPQGQAGLSLDPSYTQYPVCSQPVNSGVALGVSNPRLAVLESDILFKDVNPNTVPYYADGAFSMRGDQTSNPSFMSSVDGQNSGFQSNKQSLVTVGSAQNDGFPSNKENIPPPGSSLQGGGDMVSNSSFNVWQGNPSLAAIHQAPLMRGPNGMLGAVQHTGYAQHYPSGNHAVTWDPPAMLASSNELIGIKNMVGNLQAEVQHYRAENQRQAAEFREALDSLTSEINSLKEASANQVSAASPSRVTKERCPPINELMRVIMKHLLGIEANQPKPKEGTEGVPGGDGAPDAAVSDSTVHSTGGVEGEEQADTTEDRSVSNDDEKFYVPDPLEPGAPPRVAPDGTPLHNPRWSVSPKGCTENIAFFNAAVELFKVRVQGKEGERIPVDKRDDKREIDAAVTSYFGRLRNRYRAQTDAEAARKAEVTKKNARVRSRKVTKTGGLRQAVPDVEAHLGKENTVGLMEIIHTDWGSSEHSDNGNVDPIVFKKYRQSKIGANRARERRTLRWRSQAMVRIYALLHKFARERANGSGQKGKKAPKGAGCTPTFPCHPDNVNNNPPLHAKGKIVPYVSLISKSWMEANDQGNFIAAEDPEHFTILKTVIPDELFDDVDMAYLAEYED